MNNVSLYPCVKEFTGFILVPAGYSVSVQAHLCVMCVCVRALVNGKVNFRVHGRNPHIIYMTSIVSMLDDLPNAVILIRKNTHTFNITTFTSILKQQGPKLVLLHPKI